MPTFYFNYTSNSTFKYVNTFINDFLGNFGKWLESWGMASFKESRSVIFRSGYTFSFRSSQIQKSTVLKFGLFGGQ